MFPNLRKVEGPECEKCGCPESTRLGYGTRWGKRFERRRCAHCRTEFSIDTENEQEAEQ